MCKIMCEERGVKYFCPARPLLVDNAGMIGYLGLKMYKAGIFEKDWDGVDIAPRERTDDVEVRWR
jgi:tRNA A37 threonylcarbamoyltransferase TsaD